MSTKILAIDTATENCSVALLIGEQITSRRAIAPRDHTKIVLPMVDEVLQEAGIKLQDLDALAFGQGPGSFTGVRIGIGIAQGLAFGADLPMIGISTLAAMAQGSYRELGAEHVAVAIDARMSEVYWAQYSRQSDGQWQSLNEECVVNPTTLIEQLTLNATTDDITWQQAGTGWAAYSEVLTALPLNRQTESVLYPDAQDIVVLAAQKFAQGETVSAEDSSPVYVRDTVTWKKLPGRE